MKDTLLSRFIIIFLIAATAGWYVTAAYRGWYEWITPPQLGIDLAGGTSLVYELDITKAGPGMDTRDLAARVIEVLKKRIDPYGQKNIIWRVIGDRRIQIQMPMANQTVRDAQKERTEALEALQNATPTQSQILAAIGKQGAEREAELEKVAPKGSEQHVRLEELADWSDRLDTATKELAKYEPASSAPTAVRDRKYEASQSYREALQKVMADLLDLNQVQALLNAADSPDNKVAQTELEELATKFPLQKTQLARLIQAHRNLIKLNGGGVNDTAELQRLVTKAGVLDFRIAVGLDELGGAGSQGYQGAMESLTHGPDLQINVGGARARWFKIDPKAMDNFRGGGYVISTWAGQSYLLCYDDLYQDSPNARTLTHEDPTRQSWSVSAEQPYMDPSQGGIVLPFNLDPLGAKYMGKLTDANMHHPMAILLDDSAMSAPNINGNITSRGVITFGKSSDTHPAAAIQKEADQLKQIMDAGSLPATLQPEPISVQEISPDMGKDNIDAGIRSAYIAVCAVVGFMCVYYTITGVFADLALMLNLVLVLAAMAFFKATFTLPGIAGLVLTLGMAVDANVLINERIREEIHRGASLWMAIKQGYDKVFWTIFDANLTTSLTSIVLIKVGSEEVKGFGVTLLIGLIIHMFTALYVTRTFMMASVKWGVVRFIDDHSIAEYIKELVTFTWLRNGHWPFMRVITVSNIDWIGKRHIFWGISAVITIGGIVAFIARGDDKYDIEFRGGTQVTLQTKKDAAGQFLTIDQVRKRIEALADYQDPVTHQQLLRDLKQARVYSVGAADQGRFEMQTTIKNPTGQPNFIKPTLLDPLANAFADVLDRTPVVSIAGFNPLEPVVKDPNLIRTLEDQGIVVPITQETLSQVFAQTHMTDMPSVDVSAFKGGVAVVMDNIKPPQSADDLRTRLNNTLGTQEFKDIKVRQFTLIPVLAQNAAGKAETATFNDRRPLTRAVLVAVNATNKYDENDMGSQATWRESLAKDEWNLVTTSFGTGADFKGVTSFDAVVASEAKVRALVAIVLSLVLIVIYVWIRFGGIWYGVGAILSLIHDAIVAVAATVLSGVAYVYLFNKHPFLLITDFKINLTMIAAYLTVIGYSVNDTIVIFDRVRELRGKSHVPLTKKLINDAINQCFGRTIWTTFTVFVVVLIMYIWGGEGVRGFSFAMLAGVITGAYSTLAIASPMLLTTGAGVARGPTGPNPFERKPSGSRPPGLAEASPLSARTFEGKKPFLPPGDAPPQPS